MQNGTAAAGVAGARQGGPDEASKAAAADKIVAGLHGMKVRQQTRGQTVDESRHKNNAAVKPGKGKQTTTTTTGKQRERQTKQNKTGEGSAQSKDCRAPNMEDSEIAVLGESATEKDDGDRARTEEQEVEVDEQRTDEGEVQLDPKTDCTEVDQRETDDGARDEQDDDPAIAGEEEFPSKDATCDEELEIHVGNELEAEEPKWEDSEVVGDQKN